MQPDVDASYNVISHAHPLPTQPSPRVVEEQRVRALVARQPIALNLQGLPFERAPTVADVLMPKIRRSAFNEHGTHMSVLVQ